jgi:hypothetical protein
MGSEGLRMSDRENQRKSLHIPLHRDLLLDRRGIPLSLSRVRYSGGLAGILVATPYSSSRERSSKMTRFGI